MLNLHNQPVPPAVDPQHGLTPLLQVHDLLDDLELWRKGVRAGCMTFLPGLEVVLVSSTAGVVEGPTLVGVLLKSPPGELLRAGARLDVLPAHFVCLQDLFLVTAGVLTSLLAHEPDTRSYYSQQD